MPPHEVERMLAEEESQKGGVKDGVRQQIKLKFDKGDRVKVQRRHVARAWKARSRKSSSRRKPRTRSRPRRTDDLRPAGAGRSGILAGRSGVVA